MLAAIFCINIPVQKSKLVVICWNMLIASDVILRPTQSSSSGSSPLPSRTQELPTKEIFRALHQSGLHWSSTVHAKSNWGKLALQVLFLKKIGTNQSSYTHRARNPSGPKFCRCSATFSAVQLPSQRHSSAVGGYCRPRHLGFRHSPAFVRWCDTSGDQVKAY